MKSLRTVLALLLSVALTLPLAGCRPAAEEKKETADPAGMATALFDLMAHDSASPLCAALGTEATEASVRDTFLPDDLYAPVAEQMTELYASMGITVSEEDAALLSDAVLSMMDKIQCTAQVTELDEEAGTATVTVEVTTFPADSFTRAARSAVDNMDLTAFLSGDLSATFSQVLRAVAEALSALEPSAETRSAAVPFVRQEVTVGTETETVWMPESIDGFSEQILTLAIGELS